MNRAMKDLFEIPERFEQSAHFKKLICDEQSFAPERSKI